MPISGDTYKQIGRAAAGAVSVVTAHQRDGDTVVGLTVPLIAGSLAQIECRTSQIFISGDHAIVVGLVEAARTREGEPLLYFAQQFGSFAPLTDA